jgi:hypothetical protein
MQMTEPKRKRRRSSKEFFEGKRGIKKETIGTIT